MVSDKLVITILTSLLAFFLIWLIITKRRVERARRTAHTGYFDAFLPFITNARCSRTLTGFGRVSGELGGFEIDLQAIPDTLNVRKLPALWILASLVRPLAVTATYDLMVRPTGTETFSNFGTLPHEVPLPPGFPEGAQLRTDDPQGLLPETLIRPHLRMFQDPRIKELLISPKGVRIVWLAEEADRTKYLLFRDAELGYVPLPGEAAVALADLCIAMARDIEAEFGTARQPLAAPAPEVPVAVSAALLSDDAEDAPAVDGTRTPDGPSGEQAIELQDTAADRRHDPLIGLFKNRRKDPFKDHDDGTTKASTG
jgi:hypothetical protein